VAIAGFETELGEPLYACTKAGIIGTKLLKITVPITRTASCNFAFCCDPPIYRSGFVAFYVGDAELEL
jgi:hypothetical protein